VRALVAWSFRGMRPPRSTQRSYVTVPIHTWSTPSCGPVRACSSGRPQYAYRHVARNFEAPASRATGGGAVAAGALARLARWRAGAAAGAVGAVGAVRGGLLSAQRNRCASAPVATGAATAASGWPRFDLSLSSRVEESIKPIPRAQPRPPPPAHRTRRKATARLRLRRPPPAARAQPRQSAPTAPAAPRPPPKRAKTRASAAPARHSSTPGSRESRRLKVPGYVRYAYCAGAGAGADWHAG